ncbi:MAG: sulfatase-like hydrolase/transferase [Planctomycetota bacterium]
MNLRFKFACFLAYSLLPFFYCQDVQAQRPNIILVMSDDQGWGQTGYNNHPILKTPNLDAMAKSGLRFDRFYAAAPVCSPTRAAVLTGRTNRRSGVESHGYCLRLQEKTLSQALQSAGYATGHFGKWHLDGIRGPGVPILASDTHSPGAFGFEQWISVTNFFDVDPIMSHRGRFQEYQGDSSEIIVDHAVEFISDISKQDRPFFAVIWYGTPHSPFRASEQDRAGFKSMDENSANQHGELVAMDRSVGTLRKALRDLKIADNTIVWFTSDNGGLPKIKPSTTNGLRGHKGSVYEGGLRVPGIVEWPAKIQPRVTSFPAVSMDIFPTIADVVGLDRSTMSKVIDGISLTDLFESETNVRTQPIPFACMGNEAVIDNQWKIVSTKKNKAKNRLELFHLKTDPFEKNNLIDSEPEKAVRMTSLLVDFRKSIRQSAAGKDYAEGSVNPENPKPRFWTEIEEYKPYFEQWKTRPEYSSRFQTK